MWGVAAGVVLLTWGDHRLSFETARQRGEVGFRAGELDAKDLHGLTSRCVVAYREALSTSAPAAS